MAKVTLYLVLYYQNDSLAKIFVFYDVFSSLSFSFSLFFTLCVSHLQFHLVDEGFRGSMPMQYEYNDNGGPLVYIF